MLTMNNSYKEDFSTNSYKVECEIEGDKTDSSCNYKNKFSFEKWLISYVAIKKVDDVELYDFYDHEGQLTASSFVRLKNDCYPDGMDFNYFVKDSVVCYITKERGTMLFTCEEAVPLSEELIAFKANNSPYWGVANNKGEIVLSNTRYGRIYGMTSDGNILCLLSFVKIGIINLKSKKVLHEYSCKENSPNVIMNPLTSYICIGSDLFINREKVTLKGITQIIAEDIILCTKGKVLCGDKTIKLSEESRSLKYDGSFFWSPIDTKSYNIAKQTKVNFIPLECIGNKYVIRYPDNTYGLYDIVESKETVKKAKKLFLIGENKYIVYQTNDNKIFLYDLSANKKIKLDAEYDLVYSSIIRNHLWLVNKYEEKYCCYVFDLEGNEIIGDRMCQYGFFAPYNEESFVYIKERSCILVNYSSREETILCSIPDWNGDVSDNSSCMIIPKKDSFLVFDNPEYWSIVNSKGECLLPCNNDFYITEPIESMEKFVCSDIIVVSKKDKVDKYGISFIGAYNPEGMNIIPCEYNRIECW